MSPCDQAQGGCQQQGSSWGAQEQSPAMTGTLFVSRLLTFGGNIGKMQHDGKQEAIAKIGEKKKFLC